MNEENEATRERVTDINKCGTLASVGEYLEDKPFREPIGSTSNISYKGYVGALASIHKILEHALYKDKPNFTQYQLKLQSLSSGHNMTRAYAVLLRIMEIRFELERLT